MQPPIVKLRGSPNWQQRILERRSTRWAKWVLADQRSNSQISIHALPAEHDSSLSNVIYLDLLAAPWNEALEAPAPSDEATGSETV